MLSNYWIMCACLVMKGREKEKKLYVKMIMSDNDDANVLETLNTLRIGFHYKYKITQFNVTY